MNVSMNVNGQSKVPPGFRFHPTEEELLHYYLKKKVAYEEIDLDVIQEVDLNKLEPWDIEVKCNIGSTEQNDWYFFSHKDKKYPTGTRTNRATAAGFWKATGRDKVIHSSLQRIGMRKTLVFYNGRAPHGQKSDWIMHEYRLDDNIVPIPTQDSTVSNLCDGSHQEGWVICRVFKKKNYHIKSFGSPQRSLSSSMDTRTKMQSLNKDGVLEQLLMFMDNNKSCKQETGHFTTTNDVMHQFVDPVNDTFFHLPGLDSPTMNTSPHAGKVEDPRKVVNNMVDDFDHNYSNWADLDKFVASQLDGQMEETKEFSSCYEEPNEKLCFSVDHDDQDVWSLATSSLSSSSSMDPLCHLSV